MDNKQESKAPKTAHYRLWWFLIPSYLIVGLIYKSQLGYFPTLKKGIIWAIPFAWTIVLFDLFSDIFVRWLFRKKFEKVVDTGGFGSVFGCSGCLMAILTSAIMGSVGIMDTFLFCLLTTAIGFIIGETIRRLEPVWQGSRYKGVIWNLSIVLLITPIIIVITSYDIRSKIKTKKDHDILNKSVTEILGDISQNDFPWINNDEHVRIIDDQLSGKIMFISYENYYHHFINDEIPESIRANTVNEASYLGFVDYIEEVLATYTNESTIKAFNLKVWIFDVREHKFIAYKYFPGDKPEHIPKVTRRIPSTISRDSPWEDVVIWIKSLYSIS